VSHVLQDSQGWRSDCSKQSMLAAIAAATTVTAATIADLARAIACI